MVTLKIEMERANAAEIELELNFIKEQIEQGYISGIDWSMEGEDEESEEE